MHPRPTIVSGDAEERHTGAGAAGHGSHIICPGVTGGEQEEPSDEEGRKRNGDSDSSDDSEDYDMDKDNQNSAAGNKRGRGTAVEEAPRKKLVPEPSHMGMAKQAEAKRSALAQLSVADQELLALSMLSRRR